VLKRVALVSSGTLAGQVIAGLALLVLSRLVTPEAFGVAAAVVAGATVLAILMSGRLEMAIPTESSEAAAEDVAHAAVALVVGTSLALLVGFEVAASLLPGTLDLTLLEHRYMLVLIAAATACVTILSQLAIRRHQYRDVARRSFDQQLVTAAVQLGLCARGLAAAGLLWGVAAGRLVAAIALGRRLGLQILGRSASIRHLPSVLRPRWRFPLVFLPSALLNTLSLTAPIFIIMPIAGESAAGQLGMAQRIMAVPVALVTAAATQVVFGEMSALARASQGQARSRYVRAVATLAPIALAIMALCFFLGPTLVPILLGAEWATAGEMVRWMGIGIGLGVVAAPLQSVFTAYRRAISNLALDTLRLALVAGLGLGLSAQSSDPVLVVAAMYLGLGGAYAATLVWAYLIVRTEDRAVGVGTG
jgi:O-antigen/teichoic acid export membrane protein